MGLTVDANVLFSALLKKGETRRIMFREEITLFAPSFLKTEYDKYRNYLRKKFVGNDKEFNIIQDKLLSLITFVGEANLKPYIPAAASLIKDENGWLYLACALKENTAIWSNDKEFKKQSRVEIKTTEELIKEFGGL